jgi:nucleotide-binding universal stress UspA family protein
MERVMVALDGSARSEKALDLASDIAARYGAELICCMSCPTSRSRMRSAIWSRSSTWTRLPPASPRSPSNRRATRASAPSRVLQHYADVARQFRQALGQRLISQARARARDKGVRAVQNLLEDGDPASTILCLAKGLHVDMIFLGSRGLGDAQGLLLGSVSHKVAHLAECTCVSVK